MGKKTTAMIVACLAFVLGMTIYPADSITGTEPNKVLNPSFEAGGSGVKTATIANWITSSEKDADAAFIEPGWTHSGQMKLTHWKAADFRVCTYQTVENLPSGLYNFEFWYANGDGGLDCYVEIKDFGRGSLRIPLPKSGSWTKKEAKGIEITSGRCTIVVYTEAKAGYWINLDDFVLYDQKNPPVTAQDAAAAGRENLFVNGGFEEGEQKAIAGWQVVSEQEDAGAAYRETGWTHAGDYKLTAWKDRDYRVHIHQNIKNLKDATYALEFWYANGGSGNNCYIEIRDFGGTAIRETLPTNPQWGKVRIPNIKVTTGTCTVGINIDAKANYWINLDDFAFYTDRAYAGVEPVKFTTKEYPLVVKGIDLSTLPQVEAGGGKFCGFDDEEMDVFRILKDTGVNFVRLRIWNDPKNGICGKESTLAMAARIKKAGMGFMLDFHYSDTWADPGKQEKPAAWKDLGPDELNKAVYEYTKGIITALKRQNTLPEIVQIGNEIRGGMLFPEGRLTDAQSFKQLARLINSGIKGVRDALEKGQKIKIAIHLDRGGDHQACSYFFDNLLKYCADFEIIALSYYPVWHGKPADLYNNLSLLAAKYEKELIVAETASPFCLNDGDGLENIIADDEQLIATGYVPTIAGQKRFLEDLVRIIKHTPNGKGLGFFYWEGAWLPVAGAGWDPNDAGSKNAWENQCLFNFYGYALESLRVFAAQ